MGPTGPNALLGHSTSSFSSSSPSSSIRVTSSRPPRVPRWLLFGTLGDPQKSVKDKIPDGGDRGDPGPISWGPDPRRNGSDVLLCVGGPTMFPALYELLVEGNALLAQGTGLRRIRREITAHETEDLLAIDLGLLGPTPEGTDSDDLAPEALDELREQAHRGARADEVLHDQHLGRLTDEPVEFHGERDPPLARADPLGAVHQRGP